MAQLGAFTDDASMQYGGKHGWCFIRRKHHLQLYSGSLTRRGQGYPPKLSQAIADVLIDATRFCNTKGHIVEFVGNGGVVAKCCEPSGQSSFVVTLQCHLSFDVASFAAHFFTNQVTKHKARLCTHCNPVHFFHFCCRTN